MSNEGLRARAEKFWKEYLTGPSEGILTTPDCMANFAQQIREEDCKAVRVACRNPETMKVTAVELSPTKKVWVHYLDGNGHYTCDAFAIRNLAEKSE